MASNEAVVATLGPDGFRHLCEVDLFARDSDGFADPEPVLEADVGVDRHPGHDVLAWRSDGRAASAGPAPTETHGHDRRQGAAQGAHAVLVSPAQFRQRVPERLPGQAGEDRQTPQKRGDGVAVVRQPE